MEIARTALADVIVLTPRRFEDARGYFTETWSRSAMAAQGLDVDFVQDNLSMSRLAGTVRGLHYQRPPCAQGKLVRAARGRILDVAVDVRRGSPDYGRWTAVELSAETGAQLWVPRGFLHGFVTLEPYTEVAYKVDAPYAADCDGAVRFDDPDIGVDWGIDPETAIVSDKDRSAPAFCDFDTPFAYKSVP